MADIAELGFVVDSNPVNKAADNLNKLIPAAAGAERATDKFNKTAAASKSVVDRLAAGVRNVGTSVNNMARSLPGVSGMLDRTATAFKRVTAAAVDADDSLMAMRGNVANVAAQFQDIGVTAQMGMSPLMIGLQQGTQLSAALQAQGGGTIGTLKALGSALVSVLSPVSILTIAFVSLLAMGLQFVQWGKVIEKVLDTVADGLVTIAPYAVAGAAALALYYTPAMLGGLATLTGLLAGLAVQAVKTGIALLAANPVGALIAGFALVVTAAVIFRDDLAKMFGFDIVQAAQDGVNWIIGAFVGGFNGIKETWSMLPAVAGDVIYQAANAYISGLEAMLNTVTGLINSHIQNINGLIMMIPENLRGGWTGLGEIGDVSFGRIENPNAGAAAAAGEKIGSAMDAAQGVDYVGQGITFIQQAASGAADALHGMADAAGAMGTEVDKAGQKAADAYRKVTDSARNFILEQQTEAAALGKTEQQANTLRYAQQLLAQATADGAKITAAQRNELLGLAGQMAAAEAATNQLTEAYNFGKQTLGSFFSDFKSELMNGTSIWGAFAQAGINALSSIADKALEMAANGVWDMIFGAFTGSMGGGGGGNWISAITGSSGGIWGLNGFASGGYTGDVGKSQPAGLVHGQEFVMNAAATSRIGVDTLNAMNDNRPVSMGGGDSYSIEFAPQYNLNGLGLTAAEAQEMISASNQQLLDGLPDAIQSVQADPRKRVVRAS